MWCEGSICGLRVPYVAWWLHMWLEGSTHGVATDCEHTSWSVLFPQTYVRTKHDLLIPSPLT